VIAMTRMAAAAGDKPRKRGGKSEATFIRGNGELATGCLGKQVFWR
jgi:hypothetical protein